LAPAPSSVLPEELFVRVRSLRVLVQVLHVGVGRRVVEVEIVLLDILAVVALAAGQAEQAFLEDGVLAVPQGQGEAEVLVTVTDAGQAILVPAIGPRAGMIMREIVPGIAVRAVVLADRPPGPLRHERPPAVPVPLMLAVHQEANSLACVVNAHANAARVAPPANPGQGGEAGQRRGSCPSPVAGVISPNGPR